MRYPAAEKLEIIRLVEHAPLPVRDTLAKLGISRASFYRWYDRYRHGGPDALADRAPRAQRVWNRIPQAVRDSVIQLALDAPALSPRELAARFTDTRSYFISEASVYRLLKTQGPIASPAFIVIKAAGSFKDKTSAPNQLWQTDFTCLKVIGWGWFYLSSVLDDFSRYIVAWKLCTTMPAEDVTPRSIWHCGPAVWTRQPRQVGHLCCPTTGRATSPASWPNGSMTARSSTCAAPLIIR